VQASTEKISKLETDMAQLKGEVKDYKKGQRLYIASQKATMVTAQLVMESFTEAQSTAIAGTMESIYMFAERVQTIGPGLADHMLDVAEASLKKQLDRVRSKRVNMRDRDAALWGEEGAVSTRRHDDETRRI
jgi:Asp-tRNA(Asn)/Glu-tRNA(Gln) amidotransferase C subunit